MLVQGLITLPRYSPGSVLEGWGGGREDKGRVRDRDAMSGQIPPSPFRPLQAQACNPSSTFQDRGQKSELFVRLGLKIRGRLGHSREKPWAGHLE